MSSGACPSSNQRATLADSGASASAAAGFSRKSRSGARQAHGDEYSSAEGLSPPSTGLVNCVVCGDRACSHYYYGVAACHGCKCFFWRSVKQQAQYVCRYERNCDITVNARNVCRFCRFQRCLKAGMQPESVRMNKDDKQNGKAKKHALSSESSPDMPYLNDSVRHGQPEAKRSYKTEYAFISKMQEVENKAQEEADFNENDQANTHGTLQEIFAFPEIMDAFRTRIMYCVRLRNVTDDEMNFCKFRTLTYALDYVRAMAALDTQLSLADQIVLLRSCYGSLTMFNVTVGTAGATLDNTLLCLPTGITVSRHEEVVSNSFMSHIVIVNIIDSLLKPVEELKISETERILLKAIIVLNTEARGLSETGRQFVSNLRDQAHSTLYQCCVESRDTAEAPIRFAKLLHLLPKLMLLARDLIEHIKVEHTFNSEMRRIDPLFFELFGDIFQDERDHIAGVSPMPPPTLKKHASTGVFETSPS